MAVCGWARADFGGFSHIQICPGDMVTAWVHNKGYLLVIAKVHFGPRINVGTHE